jgi:hypothetical protein
MKKLITTVLFTGMLTTAVLAGPGATNNTRINSLFEAEYPGAEKISYHTKQDFTTIHFTWNKQRMQAFYDADGNKIGTSRTISLNSLPLRAQKSIAEQYNRYVATEAIEFEYPQEGNAYFVSLQHQDTQQKLILQVSGQGELSVFKRTR